MDKSNKSMWQRVSRYFRQGKNHAGIGREVESRFRFDIKAPIDDDALDFSLQEAEKNLVNTRAALDALNQRAQHYITLSAVGLSALFAVQQFLYSKDTCVFVAALTLILLCAMLLMLSIIYGFSVLKMQNTAPLGREPRHTVNEKYVTGEYRGSQAYAIKVSVLCCYQDRIDHNLRYIEDKAGKLRGSYNSIMGAISCFVFVIFIIGFNHRLCL